MRNRRDFDGLTRQIDAVLRQAACPPPPIFPERLWGGGGGVGPPVARIIARLPIETARPSVTLKPTAPQASPRATTRSVMQRSPIRLIALRLWTCARKVRETA